MSVNILHGAFFFFFFSSEAGGLGDVGHKILDFTKKLTNYFSEYYLFHLKIMSSTK